MTAVAVSELDWSEFMHTEETVPLNRWNQYGIHIDGKLHWFQRATTLAGILKERHGLERWGLRCAAVGFATHSHLYAKLCGTHPDDKAALDALCEKAKEAGGGTVGSDMGTGMHGMREQLDRGRPLDEFPEPFRTDLAAYQATLAASDVKVIRELVERYIVLPDIKVAGKTDGLVEFGTLPKIFDLKTGADLDYSWGEIAIQLALYAHAETIYDGKTKKHTPMPEVDQDVALVAHMPAGQGRCDLYWVDIRAGWEAVQHAVWTREWRKRRDLAELWTPDQPVEQIDVRRQRISQRIRDLEAVPGAIGQLRNLWPAGAPRVSEADASQLTAIALAVNVVEAEFKLPFGAPDPGDQPI